MNFSDFFLILGVFLFFKGTINIVCFLKRLFKQFPLDLIKRYGENSYALITGGSDGIGKAFAFVLAENHFNLILIARNHEKLQAVKAEIKAKCNFFLIILFKIKNINGLSLFKTLKNHKDPSTDIKTLVFDFKKSSEISLFSSIFNEIADLDISFLINNVGIDNCQPFIKTPPEILQNLININCFPVYLLSHHLIPRMLTRSKKSAIINLSSMSAVHPIPYFSAYGATKIFNDYLAKALSEEHKNIDFLSVKPNFVNTEINHHYKALESLSPEECVRGALADLGKNVESCGSWKHEAFKALIEIVPLFLMRKVFVKLMLPKIYAHYEKFREEINKKNK